MSECSHDCSSCGESCSSRESKPQDFRAQLGDGSSVKKVIGVVSGKGGVGKSFITSYLSVLMNRKGYHVGILDADITGPSIPAAFNVHGQAYGSELGIIPAKTSNGIDIISVNMMLQNEDDPVIWRGPVLGGVVKQFWSEVFWNDVDYMFVDMPPGTGDVPLTVYQSLPIDGLVIVTSPQELVSVIVSKAVKMASMMNIPIIGLVENYSYVQCPCCDEKIYVYGKSHVEETAEKFGLTVLDRMPINPEIAKMVDAGNIEELKIDDLNNTASVIEQLFPIED